jgi:hypothetical protein
MLRPEEQAPFCRFGLVILKFLPAMWVFIVLTLDC